MSFLLPLGDGAITAEWDEPQDAPRTVLVLAPGAGGSYATPQLRDLAATLAASGLATLRFNFAYTEAGRKMPDRPPRLLACFTAAADAARARYPATPLFLGGRSMGGRMATHLVADGYNAAGLVLLAYPLHPPGKPERIRDAHLPDVKPPMLFLQGTSDAFAIPELLDATIARLPDATLVRIEGGDHSFRVKGRKPADVLGELADHVRRFVTGVIG